MLRFAVSAKYMGGACTQKAAVRNGGCLELVIAIWLVQEALSKS